MRIRVRLFAVHRERLGRRVLELEFADGSSIVEAWQRLIEAYPVLAASAASVRFARNGRYAAADEPLADDDELALIPPVAGGAGEADPEAGGLEVIGGAVTPLLALTVDPISDATVADVSVTGVVIFLMLRGSAPAIP